MRERIRTLAAEYAPEAIGIRRHLHQHPELSFQEKATSALIREHLTRLDIPFEVLVDTGVVALIQGRNPDSRIVALRADMDALPIQEENTVPYRSVNQGVMHACGHDVHTACLLGAARILRETSSEWEGTVKLIFQPGEEKNPGGAKLMIEAGALRNPVPERIIALHVHPGLPVGSFSFREGMSMASADEIYITVSAKGGHAAAPHLTADPILVASHIVIALQQIVSRANSPVNPCVLSITAIQGGFATNVIPSEVRLMGTFRAMDETWRYKAHERIQQQVRQLAESMGATAAVCIDVGYPFVQNDPTLTARCRGLAEEYAGRERVSETELRMGAEDFAYYTHHIPGCFFRLGTGNAEKGITANVHTSTFDVDESALEHGMGMMAWLATQA